MKNQIHLLGTRRFLPLFVVQFLGAFNDNVYKNALVILVTFTFATQLHWDPRIAVTVAGGIFILPFFLFSAYAGRLADHREKSALIRNIKLAEIAIMLLGAAALLAKWPRVMFLVLFLTGTQSTFFGPLKYGILPFHLSADELIGGNAMVEAGTYLAILVGTIVGGDLVSIRYGLILVSLVVLAAAGIGWWSSFYIPPSEPSDSALKPGWNPFAGILELLALLWRKSSLLWTALGISWFWLYGATMLVLIPTFGKNILGADERAVTFSMTMFAVGIGLGSFACNLLLRGKISARLVPLAAVGMSAATAHLYWISIHLPSPPHSLLPLTAMLAAPRVWVLVDFFAIAFFGGIFNVPLYAVLQAWSPIECRARIIAANNIINALFMVLGAVLTSVAFALKLGLLDVFLILAIANLVAGAILGLRLPTAAWPQWLFPKALVAGTATGETSLKRRN